MPRPEKVEAVAEIKERLEQANAVFLAEYAGLSVSEQQDLRRGLRNSGAEFKVVKMTLARLAAAELAIDSLDELLLGPTGLAFADGDAVVAAKALKDFACGPRGVPRQGRTCWEASSSPPSGWHSWRTSSRARCCWRRWRERPRPR